MCRNDNRTRPDDLFELLTTAHQRNCTLKNACKPPENHNRSLRATGRQAVTDMVIIWINYFNFLKLVYFFIVATFAAVLDRGIRYLEPQYFDLTLSQNVSCQKVAGNCIAI